MENGYFIKNIDSKSKDYLNAKYPLFSENEYKRRFDLLENILSQNKLDKIIIYEAIGSGSAIQYFTGWHTTQEALAEVNSDEKINSEDIISLGEGTEKIEEIITKEFSQETNKK